MPARERILDRIRRNLGRTGPLDEKEAATLRARLDTPRAHLIPARAQISHADQIGLFTAKAEALGATVTRLAAESFVPEAVRDYLAAHNLPMRIKMSPDPALDRLRFDAVPMLEVTRGTAELIDTASLTPVFTAIAETGTLCLVSGRETPSTLNFLPENHIALVRASEIVGTMEESWARLRERFGAGKLPRTVNLVSGPSRTGDIEQMLIMGAHGPRRLHILIVDDDPEI